MIPQSATTAGRQVSNRMNGLWSMPGPASFALDGRLIFFPVVSNGVGTHATQGVGNAELVGQSAALRRR